MAGQLVPVWGRELRHLEPRVRCELHRDVEVHGAVGVLLFKDDKLLDNALVAVCGRAPCTDGLLRVVEGVADHVGDLRATQARDATENAGRNQRVQHS